MKLKLLAEQEKSQKTVCELLKSQCERYSKYLNSAHSWIPKEKSELIGMSAISRVLMDIKEIEEIYGLNNRTA